MNLQFFKLLCVSGILAATLVPPTVAGCSLGDCDNPPPCRLPGSCGQFGCEYPIDVGGSCKLPHGGFQTGEITGGICTPQGECVPPGCGNEVIENVEQCDGTNLDGMSCEDLGFTCGTLACDSSCNFDTSGCVTTPCCNGLPATIYGTPGNDVISGTPGDDVIAGLGGNGRIDGGAGFDVICGDEGADTILGGLDGDTLLGGDGSDTLRGNAGEDEISGGDGNDFIQGGQGNDSCSGGDGQDQILGRGGDDLLDGGPDNDVLRGGGGFDELDGGDGVDDCNPGGGTEANCE